MKLSSKGRYGLLFVLDLAAHAEHRPAALKDVAGRQGISPKYLWQVIHPLTAAGLVASVRGARGGYALGRPADRITVREIISALEGERLVVGKANAGSEGARPEATVAQEMWEEIERALAGLLAGVTVADLAERCRARREIGAIAYCI